MKHPRDEKDNCYSTWFARHRIVDKKLSFRFRQDLNRYVHRQRNVWHPNKWLVDNRIRHRPPPHKASFAEKTDPLKAAKEEEQYTPPPAPPLASLPSNKVPSSVTTVEPRTTMAPCATNGQELMRQFRLDLSCLCHEKHARLAFSGRTNTGSCCTRKGVRAVTGQRPSGRGTRRYSSFPRTRRRAVAVMQVNLYAFFHPRQQQMSGKLHEPERWRMFLFVTGVTYHCIPPPTEVHASRGLDSRQTEAVDFTHATKVVAPAGTNCLSSPNKA